MKMNLGTIAEVDLREVFSDEARDLTPWLAKEENLIALGEAVGIDLKLIQVEADVGNFSADILAEEDGSGRKVIIENQLEVTNHDHLGKVITYASGHDAGVVIWIFKNIREEHRKAIQWLNEHTDESLDFFAVSIQLWKIDESKPAPRFEVIVRPNEWAKTIKSKSYADVSDTKMKQLTFWTRFKDWVSNEDPTQKLQSPRPQHWYNMSMGSSEAHISMTINSRENLVGCEIYITENKPLFEYLQSKKNEIEKAIGQSAEWVEASKACRIKISKSDFDLTNIEQSTRYFEWLYKKSMIFKKVFGPMISEFTANQAA